MQMRVFFQKPIQISFSEIHSRHRNLFWRADPHFDVGEYVREIKQNLPQPIIYQYQNYSAFLPIIQRF